MITTELENPARASFGVSIPNRLRAKRAHIATKSERTLPLIKKKDAISKTARVMFMGDNNDDKSISIYVRNDSFTCLCLVMQIYEIVLL